MHRTIRTLAVLGAGAFALAACGSSSSSSTAPAASDSAPAPASSAPSETPSASEPAKEPVTLTMSWWGDQEAPGAKKWLEEAIVAYQKLNPNVTIKQTLQTTDGLIPNFEAAAAAKTPLDIQYFWGGIYTQQPGWNGHITPISDLLPADEIKNYTNASMESSFQGKIWTAPWYVNPSFPVLVNTELLKANGLTAPATWDDFLKTCDALSAKGIPTIAGGVKDGWFGGWLYSIIGGQSVTSQKDVLDAVVGNTKFTDPALGDWWTRLQESADRKCWNADINSTELFQAQQQFVSGKAAMTVAAGPDAPSIAAKAGGAPKIEVIAMPKWSDGPLAGKIATTSQTLGVTSWSKHKEQAADFIKFTHTTEQLNAFYEATGALPADDRFDISQVTDPIKAKLFAAGRSGAPYIENFIPSQLDSDAVFKNVQLVLKGTVKGPDAAADMQAQMERLRTKDRELTTNFTNWASSQ
jgi:ABC-type glycerol-3-phosphate transport system substrate-binding protein